MRIAVSGTHRVGKSTLIEDLSEILSRYATVEEPYSLLEEEGYEFAEAPSVEDFEQQLQRSLECLEEPDGDVLFDRCPADFLGYLLTHADADSFDLEEWLPRVRQAIQTLDLIVFVPIEARDVIAVPSSEDGEWRFDVDEKLKDILLENAFAFDVDVLEVSGSPKARVSQVMARLKGQPS